MRKPEQKRTRKAIKLLTLIAVSLAATLWTTRRGTGPAEIGNAKPEDIVQQERADNLSKEGGAEHLLSTLAAPADLKVPEASKPESSSAMSFEHMTKRKVIMPLVFQAFDPAVLKLNDRQVAAIEELRAKFIEDIGGLNQDTNDAAYRARWQKSQPESDKLLWWALGKDRFQEFQVQAHLGQEN